MPGTNGVQNYYIFTNFVQSGQKKSKRKYYIKTFQATMNESMLDNCRVTARMVLPPLEALFRINNVTCFYRGELAVIAGKAKSGKTFFTSVLMACCVKSGILDIERVQEQPLHMLWFDTEQSMQSTQEIIRDRIIPLVGGEDEFPDALFDVFNVRAIHWDQRMEHLKQSIRTYRPDLVVVDGIRDFIDDINNGVMAQTVIDELMNIATDLQCCILCIIHQNKAGEDRNLRGWIGTELTNKAFEIWNCEKLLPDHIFSVEQTLTRKADVGKTLYFEVNEHGLPVLTSGPSQAATPQVQPKKKQLPPLNQEYIIHHDEDDSFEVDVRKLFFDTLKGSVMFYSTMQHKAMALLNCHDSGYWNKIFMKAKDDGILQNVTIERKSMWSMRERKETIVQKQPDMFQERATDGSRLSEGL